MIPFGTIVELNCPYSIFHGIRGHVVSVGGSGLYIVEFSYEREDGIKYREFSADAKNLIIIEDDNEET